MTFGVNASQSLAPRDRTGRPVRVLHLIDRLVGGGSERWLWDIVRLRDAERFEHRAVTVHADAGDFVFADRLRKCGAYHQHRASPTVLRLRRTIDRLIPVRGLAPLRKALSGIFVVGWYGPAVRRMLVDCVGFRPDVLHGHTFDGLRAALLLKRLTGRPVVHTVPAQLSQMDEAGFGWMRELYARRHSSIDVFFTGASLADLAACDVPGQRIVRIHGVVDFGRTEAARAQSKRHAGEVRRRLAIPDSATILLSVGNFHSYKGQIYAIEALSQLAARRPEAYWVALGDGAERPALEKRAADLGVSERVRLPGFVTDPLPYYAAADVYLRTPVLEAENLSSYDAMAMGLPVVGFDTGSETELLRTAGHGLLVPNRDAAALASALDGVLSLADRGAALGQRGLDYARAHLDIRHAIRDFEAVYARLASTT